MKKTVKPLMKKKITLEAAKRRAVLQTVTWGQAGEKSEQNEKAPR